MQITEFGTKEVVEIPDHLFQDTFSTFGVVTVDEHASFEGMFIKAGFVTSRREARLLQNNLVAESIDLDLLFLARLKKGHMLSGRWCVVIPNKEEGG